MGEVFVQSSRGGAGFELQATPYPSPSPPTQMQHSTEEKRKRRNTQEGLSFQNSGAVERTESSFLTPHSPAFVPPEARPSRPFIFTLCPSFPQLFAAGKKAPALYGKKWTESDRRRRENDATPTSPAAGEGEHPEVPQEFYGNYADPADRVRSLPVGNHRRQQIRGVYPLRAVRRCLLLAPHPGPFLPHPAGQAGPRAFAGRGSLVVHQPGARRGRRGALPAGHWRHDLQYQSKLILQLASVHASMSVQSLPDSRCVRLLLLAGLPPVRYFWSVQKVSKRVNCWAAWKLKGGHGKMRNS